MKKPKTKEEGSKISKVTVALYIIVILGAIVFLSVSWGQTGGDSGGCCDCCCGCCAGCPTGCGSCQSQFCNLKDLEGSVSTPYDTDMDLLDYYCMYGSLPTPEQPECNPAGADSTATMINDPGGPETQDCDLQEGVCAGAEEECDDDGTWPGCGTTEYRAAAEENGYTYQAGSETLCDGQDNNCDGSVDEGCDEDRDNYCAEGMSCTSLKYNCDMSQSATTGRCTDCDDTTAAKKPGATEICDAARVDENCDKTQNEGCTCVEGTEEPCNTNGPCAAIMKVCVNGIWTDCDLSSIPQSETGPWCANGVDDDCDGPADCADSDCGFYAECSAVP